MAIICDPEEHPDLPKHPIKDLLDLVELLKRMAYKLNKADWERGWVMVPSMDKATSSAKEVGNTSDREPTSSARKRKLEFQEAEYRSARARGMSSDDKIDFILDLCLDLKTRVQNLEKVVKERNDKEESVKVKPHKNYIYVLSLLHIKTFFCICT